MLKAYRSRNQRMKLDGLFLSSLIMHLIVESVLPTSANVHSGFEVHITKSSTLLSEYRIIFHLTGGCIYQQPTLDSSCQKSQVAEKEFLC